MAIKNNLVRVHQTTHTVFNTEDVVVDTIDVVFKRITFNNESRRIESTEVERPSWLELGRIETEWNQYNIVTRRGVLCMVVNWCVRKVWSDRLGIGNVRTVNL